MTHHYLDRPVTVEALEAILSPPWFPSFVRWEGVDFLTIKELGVWKTLSMVQRCAHLSPGHQRRAIERLVTRATSGHPGIDTGSKVEVADRRAVDALAIQ